MMLMGWTITRWLRPDMAERRDGAANGRQEEEEEVELAVCVSTRRRASVRDRGRPASQQAARDEGPNLHLQLLVRPPPGARRLAAGDGWRARSELPASSRVSPLVRTRPTITSSSSSPCPTPPPPVAAAAAAGPARRLRAGSRSRCRRPRPTLAPASTSSASRSACTSSSTSRSTRASPPPRSRGLPGGRARTLVY
jgi:hypothetical protein